MNSFFTSRYNVRQLFSLIILIALLFYALGLGVWGFTRWSNPKVAEVSSPTVEVQLTVTLSPSSKKITPVPASQPSNTSLDSTDPLTSTESVASPTAKSAFPTAGAGPTKSPTKTPTTAPIPPINTKAVVQPTKTQIPVVPPTKTQIPVVPPTNTNIPVFVPPTNTNVPVLVPTNTNVPVLVPTNTNIPVFVPSNTPVPSPTNTSVVVSITPESVGPTATAISTSVSVRPTVELVPTEATVVGIPSTSEDTNDNTIEILTPTP